MSSLSSLADHVLRKEPLTDSLSVNKTTRLDFRKLRQDLILAVFVTKQRPAPNFPSQEREKCADAEVNMLGIRERRCWGGKQVLGREKQLR